MSLRELIEEKYKKAIKSKNFDETNIYRLIKSAIKYKDIENKTNSLDKSISDQQILSLLQHLIKQRKDSIESFESASREDLILKEKFEIDLINQFLPQQLNEKETEDLIKKIIKEKNLTSLKDIGLLMDELKSDHTGRVDMVIAGKIAKSLLRN